MGASGSVLRFEDLSADGSSVRVTLEHEHGHVTTHVRLRDPQEIARFFEELATDWRGWSGERGYQSDDLDLNISGWHDGIGGIRMHVQVRSTFYSGDPALPDWSASAWLAVEPGALERYASGLRAIRSEAGISD